MNKLVIIVIILLVLGGGYYLISSKGLTSSMKPTGYSSTSSAQPSDNSKQALEAETNSISLSSDDASDQDLIAVDEDIKNLQ